MKKISLLFFICLSLKAYTQTPTQKQYSSFDNNVAKAILPTFDNKFLLGGQTENNSTSSAKDIFLLKVDENGDTLWSKTYGGSMDDNFKDLKSTIDSGAIILGTTRSFSVLDEDIYITKVDYLGNIEWSKTYGSANNQLGNSIIETTSNNYILVGNTYNSITSTTDLLVIKIDNNGDTLWSKTYSGIVSPQNNNVGKKIIETTDNHYLILSSTEDVSHRASVVTKIDTNGIVVWSKMYDLGQFEQVFYNSLERLNDGFVLGGVNGFTLGLNLMKINNQGAIKWKKEIWNGISPFIADTNYVDIYVKDTSLIIVSADVSQGSMLMMEVDTNGVGLWGNSYNTFNTVEYIKICKKKQQPRSLYTVLYSSLNQSTLLFIDSTGYSGCSLSSLTMSLGSSPLIIETNLTPLNTTLYAPIVNTITPILSTSHFQLSSPCFDTQEICLVTTDSLLLRNKIIWEKQLPSTSIKYYNIYRESNILNEYHLIGTVLSDSLSEFIDSTANPSQNSYRYKISQVNVNNSMSALSLAHKTIHLGVSVGSSNTKNLIWTPYEGLGFGAYNIWRGDGTQFSLLTSVNNSITSYTDFNPSATDSVYYIEIIPWNSCVSTAKQTNYTSITSNRFPANELLVNSIDNDKIKESISIYPNPVKNNFMISLPKELTQQNLTIEMYNLLGKRVYFHQFNKIPNQKINITEFNAGMYLLVLSSKRKSYSFKILKE